MYIDDFYRESIMSRPATDPVPAESLARIAAARAENAALILARVPDRFWLRGGCWITEFWVHGEEVTVTTVNVNRRHAEPESETVSRDEARARWTRMIDAGHWQVNRR